MFYAILFYTIISVLLFVSYLNWAGIKRIEKSSIYADSFLEQNKRHIDVMEKQLENSEEQNAVGRLTVERMSRVIETMEYIKQESAAMKDDINFIKGVVLEDLDPQETNLDFQTVENMNHEIVVTEESEVEKV